jgi:hypothetical protein
MSEVIYNVTVNVSDEVLTEWLQWMDSTHIPEVLGTGFFHTAQMMRVHAFEQGGKTYAIQYAAPSMESYERYLKEAAPQLQSKTELAFGDHVHAFRTLLEVVSVHRRK